MSKGKTSKKKESMNSNASTASDNDAKKEVKEEVKEFSACICIFFNFILAVAGLGVSLVNKSMYTRFGDIDPMNLLFVQTVVNLSLALTAVGLKSAGLCEFSGLASCGVEVPEFGKLTAKVNLGLRVGLSNLGTVIFSIFAFKFSTIPV